MLSNLSVFLIGGAIAGTIAIAVLALIVIIILIRREILQTVQIITITGYCSTTLKDR